MPQTPEQKAALTEAYNRVQSGQHSYNPEQVGAINELAKRWGVATDASAESTTPPPLAPTQGGKGVMAGLGRVVSNVVGLPSTVGTAATTPPATPTEDTLKKANMVAPGLGDTLLAGKRLLVDPALAPNGPFDVARQKWNAGGPSGIIAAGIHGLAGLIPGVGPIAENLSQRFTGTGAFQGQEPDPSGATAETLGMVALPKVVEKGYQVGKVLAQGSDAFKPGPVPAVVRALKPGKSGANLPDFGAEFDANGNPGTVHTALDEIKAWEDATGQKADTVQKHRQAMMDRSQVYNNYIADLLKSRKAIPVPQAGDVIANAKLAAIPSDLKITDPATYQSLVQQANVTRGMPLTVEEINNIRQSGGARASASYDKNIKGEIVFDANAAAMKRGGVDAARALLYDEANKISPMVGSAFKEANRRVGATIEYQDAAESKVNKAVGETQSGPAHVAELVGKAMTPGSSLKRMATGQSTTVNENLAYAARQWSRRPVPLPKFGQVPPPPFTLQGSQPDLIPHNINTRPMPQSNPIAEVAPVQPTTPTPYDQPLFQSPATSENMSLADMERPSNAARRAAWQEAQPGQIPPQVVETPKIDPATGYPYKDANGNVVTAKTETPSATPGLKMGAQPMAGQQGLFTTEHGGGAMAPPSLFGLTPNVAPGPAAPAPEAPAPVSTPADTAAQVHPQKQALQHIEGAGRPVAREIIHPDGKIERVYGPPEPTAQPTPVAPPAVAPTPETAPTEAKPQASMAVPPFLTFRKNVLAQMPDAKASAIRPAHDILLGKSEAKALQGRKDAPEIQAIVQRMRQA